MQQRNVHAIIQKLTDVKFPADSIAEKIDDLKRTGAFGPERIDLRVLQEEAEILCAPLSIMFMRSLEEGVVPDDWK